MTEPVRILALVAAREGRVRAPTYCLTCGEATKGGKDRCLEHVLERDYPAQLVAEIEAREREVLDVAARGHRAIHPESPILEDVRALIEVLEVASIDRLSQYLIAELAPLDDGDGALPRPAAEGRRRLRRRARAPRPREVDRRQAPAASHPHRPRGAKRVTISQRYVRRTRRAWTCAACGRSEPAGTPCHYRFGAAETGDRPFGIRFHPYAACLEVRA